MNKEIFMDDIIELVIEKLNSGGTVTFTPNGKSMYPMLRDGEDVVVLVKPEGRLHLFDVSLYKRGNGSYVLHRIVNFDSDGSYVMCGDNQFEFEHGITDDDIIGVMTVFYRKGKTYCANSIKYRLYVNFWYYTRFFRRSYRFGAIKINKFFKKRKKTDDQEKSEQN